jgi:hypothetical protein
VQHEPEPAGEDCQNGNPYEYAEKFAASRRRSRQLMIGPNGGSFGLIGWQGDCYSYAKGGTTAQKSCILDGF